MAEYRCIILKKFCGFCSLFFSVFFLFIAINLLSVPEASAQRYSIIELMNKQKNLLYLPFSHPGAINDNGQIAGYIRTDPYGFAHAFLYSDGKITDLYELGLPTLDYRTMAVGTDINNSGQIVGYGGGPMLYDGNFKTFGEYCAPNNNTGQEATAINNSGQIVGITCLNKAPCAFLYSNGKITNLNDLIPQGSKMQIHPEDINDLGQIVGSFLMDDFDGDRHAFLYSDGKFTDLGTAGYSSQAFAINNLGQIVGCIWFPVLPYETPYSHAFLYSGGKMTDLGAIVGSDSTANGINDSGQIVGSNDHVAFIYSDGKVANLNDLIPEDPYLGYDIKLQDAVDINNKGQILCSGVFWYSGDHSDPYALLLSPENETNKPWYKDADADKYSDGTSLQAASRPSATYYLVSELTATSGDCNDNDAAIHPGATEICGDGKDNNCNGTTDEGCGTNKSWYKDTDGDKYSDGTSVQAVNRPSATYYLASELTATSGDCNDNDAAIHPGAAEICGDGKDNNCNGTTDEGCSQLNSLTGLSINGLASINENSTTSYSAMANWSDGSTSTITPSWSENSSFASINAAGVLTTSEVTSNQTVTITASYTSGSITKSATRSVTIVNQSQPVTSAPSPIPDTGQTQCYDDVGNVIPCPSPGQPFYGQDANYTINPPSYTKLDSNGNDMPDTATSWTMIRDNVTGLIWEAKRNNDGVPNYNNLNDIDNFYTWYDSNPATNGGDAGTPGDGNNTEAFINALNASNYGGHNDWRLPTFKELYSIAYIGPLTNIDSAFLPSSDANYWSSDIFANNMHYVRTLCLLGGACVVYKDENTENKTFDGTIRAVRGKQCWSLDPWKINGDGTVTDMETGLMWQWKTAPGTYTWQQALSYCENLTLAGHNDWRLPTAKELLFLVDFTRLYPAINIDAFPDTVFSEYWSSTSFTTVGGGTSDYAFTQDFSIGYQRGDKKNGPDLHYVRAVRTVQPGDNGGDDNGDNGGGGGGGGCFISNIFK